MSICWKSKLQHMEKRWLCWRLSSASTLQMVNIALFGWLTNKFCFVVEWGNLNRNHVIFGEPSDGFSKALIMMSDWNCSWQRFWKYFGPDESNLFSAILVWPWRGYFRGGLNSPLFSSLFHYPSLVFTLFFIALSRLLGPVSLTCLGIDLFFQLGFYF